MLGEPGKYCVNNHKFRSELNPFVAVRQAICIECFSKKKKMRRQMRGVTERERDRLPE